MAPRLESTDATGLNNGIIQLEVRGKWLYFFSPHNHKFHILVLELIYGHFCTLSMSE